MGKKRKGFKGFKQVNFLDNADYDDKADGEDENLIKANYEEEITSKNSPELSRLQTHELSDLEEGYFYDADHVTYIKYRNTILKFWLKNPSVRLTFDNVRPRLKIDDRENSKLVSRILKFLERYGYINYGIFEYRLLAMNRIKKEIIVIGAGAAGLAAARQLMYFGFKVIVLEASRRVGGRCYSYYKNEMFFDPGNVLVSGIKENPIKILMRQIGLNAKQLKPKHKLYIDGTLVDKKKQMVIQKIFLLFFRTLYYITIEKKIYEINGKPLTPEIIFDTFIFFLESSSTSSAVNFWEQLLHLEEELSKHLLSTESEIQFFTRNLHFLKLFMKEKNPSEDRPAPTPVPDPPKKFKSSKDCFDTSISLDERMLRRNESSIPSFGSILKGHLAFFHCIIDKIQIEELLKEKEFHSKSDKFNEKSCSEFFSADDRRILEWYFAALESFLGAPLSDYSLKEFAEDDFDQINKQYLIPDGYMNLMHAMYSEGISMNIMKKTKARKIIIHDDYVDVVAIKSNSNDNSEETVYLRADAVICTLPLGVLKKAISDDDTFSNKIYFEPPLPEHKRSAIERFGFGTVNKVTLGFDSNFWGSKDDFLGNVGLTRDSRGEFLFSYFYDPSVWGEDYETATSETVGKKKKKKQYSISSVISGNCVEIMNITDDVIIASKCYNGLKEIFENIPSNPTISVTHWDKEPFYMGTHSYPTTQCSSIDYDIMAEPVGLPGKEPRLFFAGEHTNREYPSTVHGAFLSGLRAATEVANLLDPLKI